MKIIIKPCHMSIILQVIVSIAICLIIGAIIAWGLFVRTGNSQRTDKHVRGQWVGIDNVTGIKANK